MPDSELRIEAQHEHEEQLAEEARDAHLGAHRDETGRPDPWWRRLFRRRRSRSA
jgi:hypothetical protein